MTLDSLHVILSIVSVLSGAIAAYVGLRLRAELAEMELRINENINENQRKTYEWVNGSFMRSKLVEAMFGELKAMIKGGGH